mmetsp:Transcript_34941/g.109831  ORF Transcript_34941/g.109831 Transcript_34941/m.109831 type:complete len:568 (-) Transcript_34941:247-1950(-)
MRQPSCEDHRHSATSNPNRSTPLLTPPTHTRTRSLGDRLGVLGTLAGDNGDDTKRTYVELSLKVPALNSTLHFFTFETRYIEDCVDFVRNYAGEEGSTRRRSKLLVRATGGGAYKYAQKFQDIGVLLDRRDEMACLVNGISFLMRNVPDETFSVSSKLRSPIASPGVGIGFKKRYRAPDPNPYPYLLVNIGSGVSVLAVRGPGKEGFTRISGSSLGGSTFLGLACLLTGCTTFDEALELTRRGDVCKVDMLVGDLYSGDYTSMGLNAEVIAASFGKVVMQRSPEEAAAAAAAALDPYMEDELNGGDGDDEDALVAAGGEKQLAASVSVGELALIVARVLGAAVAGTILLWIHFMRAVLALIAAGLRRLDIKFADELADTLRSRRALLKLQRGCNKFMRDYTLGKWLDALLSYMLGSAGSLLLGAAGADPTLGRAFIGEAFGPIGVSSGGLGALEGLAAQNRDIPFQREDVALSLLRMVSNNIGQIAYLNGKVSGIRKVVFGGSFLRGNPYTMASISSALEFWSQGQMEALFVNHEGFAGALGAFLCDTPYRLGIDGSVFKRDGDEQT